MSHTWRFSVLLIALLVGCGDDTAPPPDPTDITLPDIPAIQDTAPAPTDTNVEPPPPDADTQAPEDIQEPPALTCASYCESIQAVCTGTATQYASVDACLAYCESEAPGWDTGSLEDSDSHSLGCRLARLGEIDPSDSKVACRKAGPSGGGQCGSWCDNYCELALSQCADSDGFFESFEACQQACGALSEAGTSGDRFGDHIQCRLSRLIDTVFGEGSCALGAPEGSPVCSNDEPTCTLYCDTIQTTCGAQTDNAQFESHDACMNFCNNAGLPLGTLGTQADFSLGCHVTAAGRAKLAPSWHCPIAGPSGANVCGNWCKNYCNLSEAVCTDNLALFDNPDACLLVCGSLPNDAEWGADSGNSIQCRIHQLVEALVDPGADPTPLCAAADPYPLAGCVAPVPPPSCDQICALAIDACGEGDAANAQFADLEACMTFCESGNTPPGADDDTDVDTLGCRYYSAMEALKNPVSAAQFCPAVSSDGGGICGSRCEVYCNWTQTLCVGDNAIFPDAETCKTVCQTLPEINPPEGGGTDSVECRLSELKKLVEKTPDGAAYKLACDAAAYIGSTQCVDLEPTCSAYCQTIQNACTEDFEQFDDENACLNFCNQSNYPVGTGADLEGHSIGCRHNLAKQAALEPTASNCSGAGPSGNETCGTLCDAYCSLAGALCTEANILYETPESCAEQCPQMLSAGTIGELYGDSLQCRFTHLVEAIENPSESSFHCAQAAFAGGTDCIIGAGPPPTTYQEHIQPILAAHCSPCHQGEEAGTCAGSSCFVTFYEDLTLPSYYCPGKKKGECVLERVLDESMPLLGESPDKDATALIEKWLTDGMLKQ